MSTLAAAATRELSKSRPDLPSDDVVLIRSADMEPSCPWLMHGFSTRGGGVSQGPFSSLNLGLHVGDHPLDVQENRRRFAASLGLGPNPRVIAAQQVHGRRGAVASAASPELLSGVDYLVTDEPCVALLLCFADCVPILLADPGRRCFAVVHAGWKGTAARIAEQAVKTLSEEFDSHPQHLIAWIGPAIGPCCYEVSSDVARQIAGGEPPDAGESCRVDLRSANVRQLEGAGLRADSVTVHPICTRCHPELFFSYRREQRTGRMALAACII